MSVTRITLFSCCIPELWTKLPENIQKLWYRWQLIIHITKKQLCKVNWWLLSVCVSLLNILYSFSFVYFSPLHLQRIGHILWYALIRVSYNNWMPLEYPSITSRMTRMVPPNIRSTLYMLLLTMSITWQVYKNNMMLSLKWCCLHDDIFCKNSFYVVKCFWIYYYYHYKYLFGKKKESHWRQNKSTLEKSHIDAGKEKK